MAPKITATIDHLTEHEFDQIAAAGAGSRYEVVLEYTDGDHHELEAHFRLAGLVQRLSQVIGQLVRFSAFDARRLGIDKREGETVEQAVGRWLRS
jgi:hypothetical protein